VSNATERRWTAHEIKAALRPHFLDMRRDEMRGGVLLPEVPAPDGSGRLADLVFVSFTRARGRRISVIEIKTSRADWLRELAAPTKADAWWPYSDEFLIAAPTGVVQTGELPVGWGLLEPPAKANGIRWKTVVPAGDHEGPLQFDRDLLIALLSKLDTQRAHEVYEIRVSRESELQRRVIELETEIGRMRVEGAALGEGQRRALERSREIHRAAGGYSPLASVSDEEFEQTLTAIRALRELRRHAPREGRKLANAHEALSGLAADVQRLATCLEALELSSLFEPENVA
jgi:hypothetical protein